jgi:hypothetical protein
MATVSGTLTAPGQSGNFLFLRAGELATVSVSRTGSNAWSAELVATENQPPGRLPAVARFTSTTTGFTYRNETNRPLYLTIVAGLLSPTESIAFTIADVTGDVILQDWVAPDGSLAFRITDEGPIGGVVGPTLNVKAFGAVGDGVTDDTAAIQRAVDAAGGGGEVVIPAGTFLVTDCIRVPSNVTFRGIGGSSVLTVPDNYSPTLIATDVRGGSDFAAVVATADDAVNVVFASFRVEGNGDNQPSMNMSGILVVRARDVIVRDCMANNVIYNGFANDDDTRQFGVCVTDASRVLITGGRYERCGYEVVAVRNGATQVNVVGVTGVNGWRHVMQVAGGASDVTFTGCVMTRGGAPEIAQVSALTVHRGYRVTMVGCVTDLSVRIIDDARDCVITGNVIFTPRNRSAIEVGLEPPTDQVLRTVIVGNHIRATGAAGTSHGIKVFGGSRRTYIVGNSIFSEASRGVTIEGTNTRGVFIHNNVIRAFGGSGVRAEESSSQISIKDNVWDVDSQVAIGVTLADAVSGVVIDGNDFSIFSAGTKLSILGGTVTDVTVRNNVALPSSARGTATVANGNTSVAVTHGLAFTPTVAGIALTPTNGLGNAAKFWVSSPTSTQFTVNVNADPGTDTATFAWAASAEKIL